MATIRERIFPSGKRYQVRYRVNSNEKSKTFIPTNNTKTAEREAERKAKQFMKEIESQLVLGIAKDESSMKFSEYAEMVFKIHDRKASFQTKRNRRYHLDIINKHIGNWKLKDIKAIMLKKLFIELAETNSDQVLSKYKQIINIVLDSAAEEGLIEYNPMIKVKFKISQENLKEVKAVDLIVLKNYLEHAKRIKKYYFGLLLMFYTGMRIGEVLALRLDDFNFDDNIIYVTKNRQRNNEIGPVKKGHNRTMPIHEKISELYFEVNMYHNHNKKLLEDDYQDSNLFIAHDDGSFVTYGAFKSYLERLDKQIGIKIRPHQLRHTFATFLRGMEIKDIQKMGGWKDMDTLVNVYQDHDGFKDKTIEDLDKIFKNI